MNITTIAVSGVYAHTKNLANIPAGIVGASVDFEFMDPIWDDLIKTVVFQGNVPRDVLLQGNTAVIPHETVAQKGSTLKVGVYGVDAENNLIIPTLWTSIGGIRDAADPSGDPGTDPTLPIWAQLQQDVDDLKENLDAQVEESIRDYLEENPPSGGVQFETDATLKLENGVLSVNTTGDVEQDNTLPITSAAVFATVGNIEALLKTI